MFYALRVVRDHDLLTHTWYSSVRVANSPIFVYLISPFALLSHSPVFVSLCLNLLNLASVFLAYVIFKKILEKENEVYLAVLFYAVSPVAVHLSRKIWDPVPLPFFSAILFYSAIRVLARERSRWILVFLVLLFITAQIHQSAVFFAALIAGALFVHKPKLNLKWAAPGFALGLASLVPYLGYLLGGGFGDIARYQRNFGGRLPDVDVVTNFILNITGHNIFTVAQHDAVPLLNWPFPGFGALMGILMILFLPVVFYGIRELCSRSSLRFSRRPPFVSAGEEYGYNLLLICTLGLPVLYLIFRVPGVAHYFMVIFPFMFSLIPLGMTRISAKHPGWFLPGVFPLLPVTWVVVTVCFFSMISYRHGGYSFGPTYGFIKSAAGEVLRRSRIEPARLSGETAKRSAGGSGRGAEEEPGRSPGESDRRSTREKGRAGYTTGDTLRVSIQAPRLNSALPPQWLYVFGEVLGAGPVSSGGKHHYTLALSWSNKAWQRGSFSIRDRRER